jgi:purine-binding chemotaxis protein CheW
VGEGDLHHLTGRRTVRGPEQGDRPVQFLEIRTEGTPASRAAPATRRAVIVRAGGTTLALPLERCREIVQGTHCTPLPGSETFVRGLVNLRGRLVTVMDLGAWLGTGQSAAATDHATLMVEWRDRTVGITVDDVLRIALLEAERIPTMAEPAIAIELFRCLDAESATGGASVVGMLVLDRIFGSVIV